MIIEKGGVNFFSFLKFLNIFFYIFKNFKICFFLYFSPVTAVLLHFLKHTNSFGNDGKNCQIVTWCVVTYVFLPDHGTHLAPSLCYDLSNLFVDSVVWFHLLTSDYQQVGIDFIFDSLRAFALKRTVVSTWRVMDNTPVHDIQGVSE